MYEHVEEDVPCWFVGDILVHVNEDRGYTIVATNVVTGKYATKDVESFPYITAGAIAQQWQERRRV